MPKQQEWFYPTAYSSWGANEHGAVEQVLACGRLTMGEQVEAFEEEFARWHDMKHAIMVNSGSSANMIAVAALFHDPHMNYLRHSGAAKVIVPALAWSTTYAPLVQHGLELMIADVNNQWNVGRLDRSNLGPSELEGATLQVVCSILGNPAHFWDEAPWTIIEDNCESIGAVDLKGRKCGTRGVLNTFSLFWSHQLSAVEGGVILTDNDDLAKTCRMLRAHGWTRDTETPGSFEKEYEFRMYGYNVRPLEMHAAIARVQLRRLPEMIVARRKNFAHFRLRAMQEDLPLTWPVGNGEQSPFGIHFELKFDRRQELALALRAAGIDCRLPTGGSFTRHPYGQNWRHYKTPRADAIHDLGMFLGNGALDLTPQIDRAVRVMREVLQ